MNSKWNRCDFWTYAIERYGYWKIDEQIWENIRTIGKSVGVKSEKFSLPLLEKHN